MVCFARAANLRSRHMQSVATLLLCLILLCQLLSCEESLPPRIEPENTLAITDVIYVQGMYGTGPFMEFIFTIENLYEETFQEEINIDGMATIWWKIRPDVRITLPIGNQHLVPPSRISGNVLTIDPGAHCALKIYWYLKLADGRSLLDLLDYTGSVAVEGLVKSKPEIFVMEAEIKLFNQLGYLQSKQITFSFVGYKPAPKPGTGG
jgi:hypothetical protein